MADITTQTNKDRAMRTAVNRIEGFAKQFGVMHRNLALHAAFPLVLTPDLLYQIWANFVPQAPWTAVARVLLSRLCRQVGYEMYEMDITVRNLLLRELEKQFDHKRFNELGDFLLDYVVQRLNGDDPDTQDLAQAQEWTAMAYTETGKAARELAELLSARVKQEDIAEIFRLTSLIETFAEPLAKAGLEPLLIYANGMKSFFQGDHAAAADELGKLSREDQPQIAGVSLPIPEQIKEILAEKTTTQEIARPKLYALLIGIDLYLPNRLANGASYKNLSGCVRDITEAEVFLQNLLGVSKEYIFKLTSSNIDGAATPSEPPERLPTYENIVTAFRKLAEIAQPKDQVYIHYSGNSARTQTVYSDIKGEFGIDAALVPVDIGSPEGRYLRDLEILKLIKGLVDKGLVVTLVLDCSHAGGICNDIGSTWLPDFHNFVLLAGCRSNENAYEYSFDGKKRSGAFTYWLLDSLKTIGLNATYKQLFNRIFAKVHSQFASQTPQLYGDASRIVFKNERTISSHAVIVIKVDPNQNRILLNTGQAQGLRKGAEFAIYPLGIRDFKPENCLALATMIELGATESWCEIKPLPNKEAVNQGDQAVLTSASTNIVRKVRLLYLEQAQTEDEPLTNTLSVRKLPQEVYNLQENAFHQVKDALVVGNGWIELVPEEDQDHHREAAHYLIVINKDGEYEICDRTGTPFPNMRPPLKVSDPDAAANLVKRGVRLAKYQATEALNNFDKSNSLIGKLTVEWIGKLKDYDPVDPITPDSKLEPLDDPDNPTLEVGEWICLRVRNDSSQVLNITVLILKQDWSITQLYPQNSAYCCVEPGQEMLRQFHASLPSGFTEADEVIKVFATVGATDYHWLELPAIDQHQQPELDMGVLQTSSPVAGFQRPIENRTNTLEDVEQNTRTLKAVAYPSREWTTEQVKILIRLS